MTALDQFASPLWRAYFYTLALTGMRRAEALALTWEDIDLERKQIRVNKTVSKANEKSVITTPKTTSSNRSIAIGDDLIAVFESYRATTKGEALVFTSSKGESITLSQPGRQLDQILKQTDLPHLTPHGLRHMHTCLLFEAGASIAQVKERLGHADVKMTLEIYNHVTKQKAAEVPDLCSNYLADTVSEKVSDRVREYR